MAKANKSTTATTRSAPKAAAASGKAAAAPTASSTKTAKVAATTAKAPAKAAAPKATTATSRAAAGSTKVPASAPATATKAPSKAATPTTTTGRAAAAAATTAPKSAASTGKVGPAAAPAGPPRPAIKGVTKDGIAYTKDFDAKFLTRMRAQLLEEREELTGQATRLEDEANALVAEAEMGDVQFDDEGGEGDTMVVERERDLALSAQARQLIADIDAALSRLQDGTYGYSVLSGRPIPRERLEAIPWADVLVEEKAGGLGRR